MIFRCEGVAAEQIVVLLFLEQLVDEFLVVAVGDDDFFIGGLDLAHDAHAAQAEVLAVAHEAGAVVVAVAPDEDAADAGNYVQNVAATDIATVHDAFNGGSGKDFDGGGDSVCPSVGIANNPQHPFISPRKAKRRILEGIFKNARGRGSRRFMRLISARRSAMIADQFDCCSGPVRLTASNGKTIDLAKKIL